MLRISCTPCGILLWRSLLNMSQHSLRIKNKLNNKIRYFQLRCLNEGSSFFSVLFFVINKSTMSTKAIWNRLTVNKENQNKTNSTKTNELLNHMDLKTRVILMAHLKFLLTIKIKHKRNTIYNCTDWLFSINVIRQMEKNIR